MERCPHCASVHGPDEYALGYFILDVEKVVLVRGEGAVMAALRDPAMPAQVFWSPEAVRDEFLARHLRFDEYGTELPGSREMAAGAFNEAMLALEERLE